MNHYVSTAAYCCSPFGLVLQVMLQFDASYFPRFSKVAFLTLLAFCFTGMETASLQKNASACWLQVT
jgi:hypothetical protein